MNGEFQGNTLGPTTRKELREVAGGNITIEDILNRAKFDDSFPIRRFSVLVEHSNRQPLCYFFTWENGVCKYGNRCRYLHDSQIQLRTLDDRPVCPKSTMPNLSRSSLSDIIQGEVGDGQLLHGIAFIEYQGRIVWNRDGGKNSRTLWEKCLLRIASKRTQLRAIASSAGAESVQSAPESVKLIELLREENFNSLFNFLAIDDMYNMLIAFASCSYIRNESRTCMLSNTVWDSAISKKWELPYTHHDNPIQAFMSLEYSSKEAHAFLSSSTNGLFTHGNSAPDTNPCSGVPALADLENTLVGKTILISDDGVPIVDIRFTNSLIATANGCEISLVRRGDLVKVSTSTGKQKNSADKLALVPSVSGNNWLVHAGTSDLFLRDVDEPGLKLVKKISPPSDYPSLFCCSLDATSQAAYVGYTDFGMSKVDIETGMFGSLLRVDGFVSSRQWSSDGRLHVFSSSNDSLAFWDLRMKDRIPLVSEPSSPCVFSFSEFASPLVVVGCSNKLSGVDIRTGKFLWSIPTHSPVTHLSVSRNIVSIFTGTISNPLTEISVHDLTRDASLPTRIGEHQIPFRVSAVGYPCDSSTSAGGCVFAVKSRPKRSGRGGDDGILCVGGSGFMNPPMITTKRVSSAGSTPRLAPTTPPIHNRRSSRDHQRVVHFLV